MNYIPNHYPLLMLKKIDADVAEPISRYSGKVIAVIYRKNVEDKYVVANQNFSKEEIYHIMERFYSSIIEMNKDEEIYESNKKTK